MQNYLLKVGGPVKIRVDFLFAVPWIGRFSSKVIEVEGFKKTSLPTTVTLEDHLSGCKWLVKGVIIRHFITRSTRSLGDNN